IQKTFAPGVNMCEEDSRARRLPICSQRGDGIPMALNEKTTPGETEGGRIKLGDLKRVGGRSGVSALALRGFNLNNSTLSVTMPMETFREISVVANEARIVEAGGDRSLIAQRPLDQKHAKALALYML